MGFLIAAIFFLIEIGLVVAIIAGMWKTFVKAGQPGWGCLIPIYNIYLLCLIGGKPAWWIVLMFIPFVNIAVLFLLNIAVAAKFGKSAAFGIGLTLLGFIFFPILGFGDAQYSGSAQPAMA